MKPLLCNAILLALVAGSVHAQSVPAFINYQGRVTDSAGAGLGTGTPVNRKMIFRLFDAATGGNRVWSEEQTVTVANGEFSVLLGNGINATYSSVTENPRNSLTTLFGSGDRYLELVVDNGDGTFNTSDTPIAPRQRLTSTAYAMRAATADSVASGSDLSLRDANVGLGWYGAGRLFNGQNIDGPVLYGYSGGALGSNQNGTQRTAIRWDGGGNVGIGTASPSEKLDVTGNAKVSGSGSFGNAITIGGGVAPPTLESGGAGMRLTLYPGNAAEPPFGFGIDGSTMFSVVPISASHKWYGGSNLKMSLSGSTGNLNVSGAGTFASVSTAGNVTGGTVTATGNLSGGSVTTAGAVTAGSVNAGAGTIATTGNLNSGKITSSGDIAIGYSHDFTLLDANHGLGYYGGFGSNRLWNTVDVNGPVLYGYNGGALAATLPGSAPTSLRWTSDGDVAVNRNLSAGGTVSANGKKAVVGEEELRIVRGIVRSAGAGIQGTDYSSPNTSSGQPQLKGSSYKFKREGTQNYTITFAVAFSDTPSFTFTPYISGSGIGRVFAKITGASNTAVSIMVINDDNQGYDSIEFDFIAIGPR